MPSRDFVPGYRPEGISRRRLIGVSVRNLELAGYRTGDSESRGRVSIQKAIEQVAAREQRESQYTEGYRTVLTMKHV